MRATEFEPDGSARYDAHWRRYGGLRRIRALLSHRVQVLRQLRRGREDPARGSRRGRRRDRGRGDQRLPNSSVEARTLVTKLLVQPPKVCRAFTPLRGRGGLLFESDRSSDSRKSRGAHGPVENALGVTLIAPTARTALGAPDGAGKTESARLMGASALAAASRLRRRA
jgi:hypothetical protein